MWNIRNEVDKKFAISGFIEDMLHCFKKIVDIFAASPKITS